MPRGEAPGQRSGPDFVHLHLHSEYSLLDGISSVEELVGEAARHGMDAMALTDHGVLYGAIEFYLAAQQAGVKPIIGVEAYMASGSRTSRAAEDRQYSHLILLASNDEGYRNLLKLVTAAHLEGLYYKPRIDRELLAQHHHGLIVLSSCASGEPSRAVLNGDIRGAMEAAAWYRDLLGPGRYYLELQDHGMPEDATINRGLIQVGRELGIPLVATNDVHYARPEQAGAQDVLLCIQMNTTLDDPKRMRMEPATFYLKSPTEMAALFTEVPEALSNTRAVAEACDLKLRFDRLNFPELRHIVPEGESPEHFLARVCRERLPERYPSPSKAVKDRLEYELDVILKTGFAPYILFVWDFVSWARQRGIMCTTRGSAAASIVLYILGVTTVDPMEYGLAFERFLNLERIQPPDVDMDFADDRRDEVIEYVVQRYGRDHVAQIITFGRLLARAAIRDVGRALAYPLAEIDRVAKLVPPLPVGITIDQALQQSRELKQLYDTQPEIKKLIDTAKQVEGVVRHASTHAAGVVVSGEPLVHHVPLQRAQKGDSVVMTQYDMKSLEKIGLLKMDFLGLANLTMLEKAVKYVEETRGQKLDLAKIPLDDARTFEMLTRGETHSVFQLEGAGMTRYIKELKPTSLRDVAAMIALYRPGPMAHIPDYIAAKEGRKEVRYLHPRLEPILKETYGILVYQDQVLQAVRAIAGYSLGRADILRRAMGKKLPEEMKKERSNFLAGAKRQGVSEELANQIWEYIEPFAGYAFNKSHAVAYAFISYQTAYLKANYPVEWMAAVLTTEALNTERVVSAVGECKRLGIQVLGPDINRSGVRFTVERIPNGPTDIKLGIRYGLAAVKNVGEGAVEHLIAERERGGPYRSLEDMCRRLDLRTVNKRVIESLIKCGALDELGERAQLLAAVDQTMAAGQQMQKAQGVGQTSLFDLVPGDGRGPATPSVPLPQVPPATARQRLAWEKEVLGFYLSDHPFQEAARYLASRVTADTSQLAEDPPSEKVTVAGVVTSARKVTTRKRETMVVATLEDLHGSVQVVAFPRVYEGTAQLWREDAILVIEGKVDERHQLICDAVEEWSGPLFDESSASTPGPQAPDQDRAASEAPEPSRVRAPRGRRTGVSSDVDAREAAHGAGTRRRGEGSGSVRLLLTVPRTGNESADIQRLERLRELLQHAEGEDTYEIYLAARGKRVRLSVPDARTVYSEDLDQSLRELLGPSNVTVLRGV